MSQNLRISIAQVNLLVGDIAGNMQHILDAITTARDEQHTDVILFPELTITGYPPVDLLLRPDFRKKTANAISSLAKHVKGIDVVVGYPCEQDNKLYNAASLIRDGKIISTYFKHRLPNYGVFDEKRYFDEGTEPCVVDIKGVPVGITICEDIWFPEPVNKSVKAGAKLIFNLNASPYHLSKTHEREDVVAQRIHENSVPVVYANLVGGQDELVFDGDSFVMDENRIEARAPAFKECLYPVEVNFDGSKVRVIKDEKQAQRLSEVESVYSALVLGVRDYINKNGFKGVVIGMSGGIDSALTATIAVDAIGKDRVEGVMMPSRYTADMSVEDALAEAKLLGIEHRVISIEPLFTAFTDSLKEEFAGLPEDTTEENIQARCRGVLLMAISNKKRKMVLTTGNKSEMAVGYATLYGDMAGGYGALKDVPKTMVYRLADYRNSISPVIPQRVIDRPPSAELRPDQKDEDSLPSYDVLDAILEMYVESDRTVEEMTASGYDEDVVRQVTSMIDRNEYKRRQAPPGVRITKRAFGSDRRYPITSGFGANSWQNRHKDKS
ncbi:MAG: NAD+ synthase [Gammaproteobacteria bacterium]|nr:NAD+ synthase [Gammaproteobacteria bacterium]